MHVDTFAHYVHSGENIKIVTLVAKHSVPHKHSTWEISSLLTTLPTVNRANKRSNCFIYNILREKKVKHFILQKSEEQTNQE